MARVTITERDSFGQEKLILTRSLEVESKKQLTRGRAAKILKREHPELGQPLILIDRGPGFVTTKAVEASTKCSYHFVWRDYYIAED